VDLFLPPLSLYVLSGPSRYSYTHELLPTGDTFGGVAVERDHRLSVIFRDAKVETKNKAMRSILRYVVQDD
jgi:alkylated DNA repair protein alkB family protein 7